MDNNTVSKIHTHFLQGVSIIEEARKKYLIAFKNWTYPLKHYGDPHFDDYYAEIWIDGMDDNVIYWLLEKSSSNSHKVIPLLKFNNTEDRNDFNDQDFYKLLEALVWKSKAIKQDLDQKRYYIDNPWGYMNMSKDDSETHGGELYIKCVYEHSSQEAVVFWVNNKFLIFNDPLNNE